MKYLMLIYGNPETWAHPVFLRAKDALDKPETERREMADQLESLLTEIRESGELIMGEPLADPGNAMTVRVRDGVPATTDGPYVESKEQMAGFFVVDCATPERAEEIAGRFPDARFWGVELRPIMGPSGQEM